MSKIGCGAREELGGQQQERYGRVSPWRKGKDALHKNSSRLQHRGEKPQWRKGTVEKMHCGEKATWRKSTLRKAKDALHKISFTTLPGQ